MYEILKGIGTFMMVYGAVLVPIAAAYLLWTQLGKKQNKKMSKRDGLLINAAMMTGALAIALAIQLFVIGASRIRVRTTIAVTTPRLKRSPIVTPTLIPTL